MEASVAHLRSIRLEPSRETVKEDENEWSSADEVEDPPSPDNNQGEAYEVDAIKCAEYKDSRRYRSDGKVGWHYMVMWKGYLKSTIDSEEFFDCFQEPEEGQKSLPRQFWEAVGRPLRTGGREPLGTRGEHIECPEALMKEWLSETKPSRFYSTYKRRREKELNGDPILKGDSDYHVRKRRKRQHKREKKAKKELKPETVKATPSASDLKAKTPKRSKTPQLPKQKSPSPEVVPAQPPIATAEETEEEVEQVEYPLDDDVFVSDHEVEEVLDEPSSGGIAPSIDNPHADEEVLEPLAGPSTTSKRKRRVDSPVSEAEVPAPEEKVIIPASNKRLRVQSESRSKSKSKSPANPPPTIRSPKSMEVTPVPQPPKQPTSPVSVAPAAVMAETTAFKPAPGIFDAVQSPEVTANHQSTHTRWPEPLFQPSEDTVPEPVKQSDPQAKVTSPIAPLSVEAEPAAVSVQQKEKSAPIPPSPIEVTPLTAPVVTSRPSSPLLPLPTEISAASNTLTATTKTTQSPEETNNAAPAVDNQPSATAMSVLEPEKAPAGSFEAGNTAPSSREPSAPTQDSISAATESEIVQAVIDTKPEPPTDDAPTKPAVRQRVTKPFKIRPIKIAKPHTQVIPPTPPPSRPAATSKAGEETARPLSSATEPPLPNRRQQLANHATQPVQAALKTASLPSKPAHDESAAPPTPASSIPTSASAEPMGRKKYEQPKRMQTIDSFADPEAEARLAKKGLQPTNETHIPTGLKSQMPNAARSQNISTPTTASSTSPVIPAPSTATAPAGGYAPRKNMPAYQPRTGPTGVNAFTSTYTPWVNRIVPSGPSAQRNIPTGPSSGAPATYANMPAPPVGGMSPVYGGISPVLPSSAGGMSPLQPTVPIYNASIDPRRRQAGGTTPNQAPTGASVYIQPALDPRRSGLPPTPISSFPPEPPGPAPPLPVDPNMATGSTTWSSRPPGARHITHAVRAGLPIRQDFPPVLLDLAFYRGASSDRPEFSLINLPTSRNNQQEIQFEMLEGNCLEGQLKHGARIAEWAKVGPLENSPEEVLREWDILRSLSIKDGKIFAWYTEQNNPAGIDCHIAVVLVAADRLDFSSIPLAGWKVEEIGLAMIVLILPLDSPSAPDLPNPIKPLSSHILRTKAPLPISPPCPVLDSYGLNHLVMESLTDKVVWYRDAGGPRNFGDQLRPAAINAFKRYRVQPVSDKQPDRILVPNQQIHTHMRSSTLRDILPRKTTIMTVGPTLGLLPSQWQLRPVWQTGGLVTFSPTFILRYPEKFLEIMDDIRISENWGAYVVPAVIDWVEASWKETARCPNAAKAFSALSSSLYLDHNQHSRSGSGVLTGGGLAISLCPPTVHQPEACMRWLEWLHRISTEKDYNKLVQLVKGINNKDFEAGFSVSERKERMNGDTEITMNGHPKNGMKNGSLGLGEVDLVDVETKQLEDLIAMRARPEIVPYRRYIYVGQMSMTDRKMLDKAASMIEFVAPENFIAVFSGAV